MKVHVLFACCMLLVLLSWPRTTPIAQQDRRRQTTSHAPELRRNLQQDEEECRNSLHQAAANAVSYWPVAKAVPHTLVAEFKGHPNDTRTDDYYWLMNENKTKNVKNEVQEYLKSENAYTMAVLADTHKLQMVLRNELVSRWPQKDLSPPLRQGPYYYYGYRPKGSDYWVHVRKPVSSGKDGALPPPSEHDAPSTHSKDVEEVLLDENLMAKNYTYFDVGDMEVSPNHELFAFSMDVDGGETYGLRVMNMSADSGGGASVSSGQEVVLLDELREGQWAPYVAWAPDNITLYAVRLTTKTRRAYQVVRYTLGEDEVSTVYTQEDEHYEVRVQRARSGELMIISGTSDAHEYVNYTTFTEHESGWVQLNPKSNSSVQSVAHWFDLMLYINYDDDQLLNGQLVVAQVDNPKKSKVLLAHNKDVLLEDIRVSSRFLSVLSRHDGTQSIHVYELSPNFTLGADLGKPSLSLRYQELPNHALEFGMQGDFESDVLRVRYTSLVHPWTTVDVNQKTGNQVIKKVESAGTHYNQSMYFSERINVVAQDGSKIPVSIVYRPDVAQLDGKDPMLIHVYGAYGMPLDPAFSRNELSLLNRGFVVGIAHVRGGNELGRYWHTQGKLMQKKNTFTDLLAVAEHVIQIGYTSAGGLCVWGRSAGGLTVAAALNMKPQLFKCAILDVPFVDVLTAMRNEDLPLTVPEWEEWGDPLHEREAYEYMKSYSPYDQLQEQEYPDMFVTGGLWDPRVPYWQPAKYVAKLRVTKNDNNVLMMKMNMEAGHFAGSGLSEKLNQTAQKYAFLLKSTGAICTARAYDGGANISSSNVSLALGILLLFAFILAALGYMGYRRYKSHGMADLDSLRRKLSGANVRAKEVAMRAFPQASGYERTDGKGDFLDNGDSDDEK